LRIIIIYVKINTTKIKGEFINNMDIIATPSGTDNIIRKFNLKLYKGLGQNFLIDQNIIKKIIEASNIEKDDIIIEIGPGIGSLTQFLLEEIEDGKYFGLEKDKRLVGVLQEIFTEYQEAVFLNADVMEFNWDNFLRESNLENKNIKIIGNLPYYITTPLIIDLLKRDINCLTMIFMVQKEVAERMVSAPGSKVFGSLSVVVQFYSNIYKVDDIPPTVFRPRPNVDSSIVCINPYEKVPYDTRDEELFFNVVRGIFQQRRKKIKNSLLKSSTVNFKREEVMEGLKRSNINPGIRGEKLEIEKMVELSNALYAVQRK